jgi:hypothetical protein
LWGISKRKQAAEGSTTLRRFLLSFIPLRIYKTENNSKAAFTHLMPDCMIEPWRILEFLMFGQN